MRVYYVLSLSTRTLLYYTDENVLLYQWNFPTVSVECSYNQMLWNFPSCFTMHKMSACRLCAFKIYSYKHGQFHIIYKHEIFLYIIAVEFSYFINGILILYQWHVPTLSVEFSYNETLWNFPSCFIMHEMSACLLCAFTQRMLWNAFRSTQL